ncbi:MAG: hypothetical protein K5880_13775 [Hydrogenophaga sp.]|uniref:hypothetical protein n=1 Tax=Hydrogenophaga sp. TaxID=1904254 RepID=UPI00260A8608|nr:hypothetical protein [Hydrogenophaga sp.]MCV0439690.1 hypothetical protein [Hydrogenophaga sp.]
MQHGISFRGLWIEGSADYEPATGPTYSCGGTPPSWDAEVSSITLDDPEEFSSWCLLEDFSEGVSNMVDAYHRLTGKLLPRVEALVWDAWEEEILSELMEAESTWEPDYDEDRYDD